MVKIEKNLNSCLFESYNNMVSTNTNTKTKNTVLLALISTTFILSIVSYAHPQAQQQAFAQGFFQSQQEESEALNNQSSPVSTTTPTEASVENGEETRDQKIILGDITIPINSNTTLSLEMQDSKITVQPNQ
jgi:hypothetical protein